MHCERCGGLMRRILLRDRSNYTNLPAFRCLICAEIMDEVILANRHMVRHPSVSQGRHGRRSARHYYMRLAPGAVRLTA
ncbi:MAG: hypothetical protein H6Q05_4223 [Acidobacteria bacterium]|jgi:hypothetical protein|nr:hypothetical protein [Acidobacteriota bacterium]